MEPLHPCPCCGYFTFTAAPPYTLQFCEICFWEDGGEQSLSSLRYAQRNFLTLGACDPVFRHDVRLPDVSDRRVEQWQSLDTLIETARTDALQSIAAAFDGVSRGRGVTLHEADVIDSYGSDELRSIARLKDTDRRWQEIPETDIERHSSSLSFLDCFGFCYYIPAYMTWTLNHYETSSSMSVDMTIYQFKIYKGLEKRQLERFTSLDQAQSHAVCQFLYFIVSYGKGYASSKSAQTALEQYWGKYCKGNDESAVEVALKQYWKGFENQPLVN